MRDIEDVFKRCKAERNKDGVNDAVKEGVEAFVFARNQEEENKLADFFHQCDIQKVFIELITETAVKTGESDKGIGKHAFQQRRRQATDRAKHKEQQKKLKGLLFDSVFFVNIPHQKDGGQAGYYQKDSYSHTNFSISDLLKMMRALPSRMEMTAS